MTHPKASIIILDYLKAKRVCENVRSILAQKVDFPVEVVVIDNSVNAENAAQLKTLEGLPNVKVVVNERNTGYVQAHNQGVRLSSGELVLIVNPDIVWREPDTLQKLVGHMEAHPEIGVLGPRQVNEGDGSVAMTVRAFPKFSLQVARRTWIRRLPIVRNWVAFDEMRHLDYSKEQPVDWLQSSFWVTRRALWDRIGGLDPRYFLFMSDPDYCFKCWEAGYQVVYTPKATVHADGIRLSSGGFKAFFGKWTLRQHVVDSVKYRWSHFLKPNPRNASGR